MGEFLDVLCYIKLFERFLQHCKLYLTQSGLLVTLPLHLLLRPVLLTVVGHAPCNNIQKCVRSLEKRSKYLQNMTFDTSVMTYAELK